MKMTMNSKQFNMRSYSLRVFYPSLRIIVLWLVGFNFTAQAQEQSTDFKLISPLECPLGVYCFIWQYPDHDLNDGAKDYKCGGYSYDTHKGTDFFVPYKAMKSGANVVASAAGKIKALRDGVPDRDYNAPEEADNVQGIECGNGVVIDHGNNWETQYCHMKNGSLSVQTGQIVNQGEKLGEVGLSGFTEFPHIHIAVRYQGEVVDPFRFNEPLQTCGDEEVESLWANPQNPIFRYRGRNFQDLSFQNQIYGKETQGLGFSDTPQFTKTTDKILLVAMIANMHEGDRIRLSIQDPQGVLMASSTTEPMPTNKARYVAYVGKKRRADWPLGEYIGQVEIMDKKGKLISRAKSKMNITQ